MAKQRNRGSGESRGKQRRAAARAEREKQAPPSAEPASEPAFWFGFEVSWAKLVLGRVVVFALLAIDALMQISHAPRYGAGNFNVAQLPLLDAIAPGRVAYSVGQLLCAYLFVLVACGVATRYVLPIATAIYGWLYFSSQLDSYQHHYLVFLVLLLACFVPWQRPTDAVPATRVRTWALRLILVQFAVLYFWAAISKLSPAWLDGRTLSGQIHGSVRSLIDGTIGIKAASWLVVITELALAATVWLPRAWWLVAPLGLVFHAGILKTGLEIGLFAYLMLGLYIFVVPDRIWVWLAERKPLATTRAVLGVIAGWFSPRPRASGSLPAASQPGPASRADARDPLGDVPEGFTGGAGWLVLVFGAGVGLVLAVTSRFDHGPIVGCVLGGAVLVAAVLLRKRVAVAWLATAHLLAFTTWTIVDRTTSTASDYFRFWGGSSRRLGDVKTAEHAYRRMTEVAPDEGGGHFQLGRLLIARGAGEEGVKELRLAQALEPLKSRAYVAEARWLAQNGQRDEAIAKAREATIIDPTDSEARALLDNLTKR